MARRRIGLFMSEISQYFQEYCGKAIIRLAAERDIDVIIFSAFYLLMLIFDVVFFIRSQKSKQQQNK